jgi:hypothetical protein
VTKYIVTIKLPRNPEHNPRDKKIGACPMASTCTDATGEHHSGLVTLEELAAMRDSDVHITRVETID